MTFAAYAHRGGSRVSGNVENTIAAFQHAYDLGFRHFETDVHLSRDGVVYVFHDPDLRRMAGRPERIEELTAAELDEVSVGGRPIPRLSDALDAFPDVTWNIDIKAPAAIAPTLAAVEAAVALPRTMFGSFRHRTLRRIRRLNPLASTSASRVEVALAVLLPAPLLRLRWRARALQVPHRSGPVTVVTARFVRRAHALGVPVHVWTIDDADEMASLLDLGIDGLMTDRTDTLRSVLEERGQWA